MKEQSDPPYIPSPTKAYARTPRNNHCNCDVVVDRKPYYYRGQGCWQRDSRPAFYRRTIYTARSCPACRVSEVQYGGVALQQPAAPHITGQHTWTLQCSQTRQHTFLSCLFYDWQHGKHSSHVSNVSRNSISTPPTLRLLFSFLVHCSIVKENQG